MNETYKKAKKLHPGMVLLFPEGDYYQMYEEDAILTSKILELTTMNHKGTLMAGFHKYSLEQILVKLLKNGNRVAICEETPL